MPLLLFRSAMVLRLWLALAALLASFFLRSWVVSRLCPWPRGPPVTAVEFSGRYPFLARKAMRLASAFSLSTAGSWMKWSGCGSKRRNICHQEFMNFSTP